MAEEDFLADIDHADKHAMNKLQIILCLVFNLVIQVISYCFGVRNNFSGPFLKVTV